jgi:hypothetical protein
MGSGKHFEPRLKKNPLRYKEKDRYICYTYSKICRFLWTVDSGESWW